MLLVDIVDHLDTLLGTVRVGYFSPINLICIIEPNRAVVIFTELTAHLEYLNIVHLLNIVAHFEALLVTVVVTVLRLDQSYVLATGSIIVFY